MWSLLDRFIFSVADKVPLVLPDSIQKAKLTDTIAKITNLDLDNLIAGLLEQATWVVVKLIIALIVYFIGRWMLRRLIRLLDIAFERRQVDTSLRSFLRNTVRVLFSLILVLCVVQALGVNVTSLVALFSAATLAVGMALSGTAQNFAGGVMILLMKPYRVGDYISTQGQSGIVREIKLFSTVINTTDHRTIYIPNNIIATAIIDNYSTADTRRVEWTVGISYGDNVDVARSVILEILAADSRVLPDPAAVVWVGALAGSSVNLTVRVWTLNADFWDVFYENNEKFYKQLPLHGISFPFPQMDVHLKQTDR